MFHRLKISLVALACAFGPAGAGEVDPAGPPEHPLPWVNWEGFYAGVNAGFGFGDVDWSNPQGWYGIYDVPAGSDNDGLIVGAQAGYLKQLGQLILGVEAGLNSGSRTGYAPCGSRPGEAVPMSGDICGSRIDAMGSLTGRVGVATGQSMVYVKGGGAFSREKVTVSNPFYPDTIEPGSDSSTRYGWTAGAGVAHAMGGNWFVFADYEYYDFGDRTYTFEPPSLPGSFDVANSQHLVKFGANYRFGGEGAAAPPSSPAQMNGFKAEIGTRAGYSTGSIESRLYTPYSPGQLISVLNWSDQAGFSAEVFGRLDHRSGVFVKGTFGGVDIGSSDMTDMDTAEAMYPEPASKTRSETDNGDAAYFTADLGYTLWDRGGFNLGAFVGYGYYQQNLNAYGCEQLAPGAYDCSEPDSVLGLSQTERWDALRLGLAGQVNLNERLTLAAEAAWLPYVDYSGTDNHWHRPDINPLPQFGDGSDSYQLEASLSYAVTENWSVGAGVRYLSLQADGHTVFPSFPEFDVPATEVPETYESTRLTTFLQASYKFGTLVEDAQK